MPTECRHRSYVAFLPILLVGLLLIAAPPEAAGQTTLYDEDFESYSDGATNPGSWTRTFGTNANPDFASVQTVNGDKVFQVVNADGGGSAGANVIWETQDIDISSASGVSFSIAFDESGDMESSDYIDVEYSTDGGSSFTRIDNADGNSSGNTLNGNFTSATVSEANLSGTTLVIRVTMNNSAGSEQFQMDDVEVTSAPIVRFTSTSATVSEGGSATLTAELLNPPSSSNITADVNFKSRTSTAESGDVVSTGKSITLSSSTTKKDVSFDITDDSDPEGLETAVYALENVSGTNSVKTGTPSTFDVDIQSSDLSVPLTEDFDGDPLFTITEGTDAQNGTDNYFTLDDGSGIGKSYSDSSGTLGTFFAGQDIDDDQVLGTTPGRLTWSDIDISGASGLEFTGRFAEVDDGSDIEQSDFLTVEYRIDDGSWNELIDFHGSATNGDFKVDTDSDGVGEGTNISSGSPATMVPFDRSISGTGSTLDLRFTASVGAADEDFAIEDFEVTGTVSPAVRFTAASGTARESDGSTALAVEIVKPPSNTQVSAEVAFNSGSSGAGSGDINSFGTKTVTFPSSPSAGATETVTVDLNAGDGEEGSEDAVFDLQNVSGASASVGTPGQFTLTIQDDVGDHAGDVLITELMPDPDKVGDADGEYIELYNATGSSVSIDGWDIFDGTAGSISGVTVPARGFAVVCRNSDASANGGIDCDDQVSFVLSNSGEQIQLRDGNDNQIDVVDYGGANFPSVPTGSSLILTETADNNSGSNWAAASRRERGFPLDQSGDNGSPGRNGTGQTLQPTAEITGGSGWRMLSAPMGGVTPNDLAEVSFVQGISGLPYSGASSNLYRWPGGQESNNSWEVIPSATTDLTGNGRGYIWYVFDTAEAKFTDTPPFTLSLPGSPRTSSVSTGALGEGFHLVGNPFAQSIDPSSVGFAGQGFQSTVQVYSPGTGYEQVTTSYTADDFIGAYQGFFVERSSGSNTLSFASGDRVADPVGLKSRESVPPRVEFRLVGRDEDGSVITRDDGLILHAPEEATVGWDVHDASKLTPISGRYATVAFRDSVDGASRLQSVASIPRRLPEGQIEFPVSLQLQGTDPVETFHFSWPEWTNVPGDWKLALHDTVADTTINLRADSSYTFAPSASEARSVSPPAAAMELPDQLRAKAQSHRPRFTLSVQTEPLPVELATVDVVASGRSAELQWRTASETNNSGFYVEHKADTTADAFRRLGFVDGAGTTQSAQSYSYRVEDLDPGTHVFRLRQVDVDGTETVTEPVSVRVVPTQPLTLSPPSPNPVRNRTTATVTTRHQTPVTVALFDALGRRVRTIHDGPMLGSKPKSVTLATDDLPSGLYLLRATDGTRTVTRKLTVVR